MFQTNWSKLISILTSLIKVIISTINLSQLIIDIRVDLNSAHNIINLNNLDCEMLTRIIFSTSN